MKVRAPVLLLALGTALPVQATHSSDRSEKPLTIETGHYRQAEQRLVSKALGMTRNLFVTPHWIGDTDHFWYQRGLHKGHEFVVVDASSGARRAAFDHQKLADALREAGEGNFSPNALPLQSIELSFEAKEVRFRLHERTFVYKTESSSLETLAPRESHPGLSIAPNERWGIATREGNLYLRDLASGEERALTEDGEEHHGYGIHYGNWKASHIPRKRSGQPSSPMAVEWAPDSSRVLVPKIDQRHVADYAWIETVPDDGSFRPKVHRAKIPLTGEEMPTVEWYLFDISKGTHVRVDLPYEKLFHVHQDMLAIRRVEWDLEAERLFAVAFGDNLASSHLFEIDLRQGTSRAVIHEAAQPRMDLNSTSYNPPNVRAVSGFKEFVWFSQRDGWGHLYLYNGQGELLNQITEGPWLVRDILHIDEKAKRIYFTACGREEDNPYHRYLYRVGFDGSDLVRLSLETADHMLTAPGNDILSIDGASGYDVVSPSGRYVVYNYSTLDQPTRTIIRRTGDASLVAEVERANVTELLESGWRPPRPFVAKAADGETDLYGVFYEPPQILGEGAHPIIDSQYASPLTAVVPRNFLMTLTGIPAMVRPASLAELGFVSVVIDARGTTFRSREFSHHSDRNLHRIGLEDHVAALRQLAKEHPWMDIERVGIHGGSYGGYTTFRAMLEFPEFFKVGVSSAGMASIHNMYPDYHWTAFHGKPVYADGSNRRGRDDERPRNYDNADSNQQAEKLQGKLLIMLGELDENVLPATTLQLIDTLIKLDKDFDMLYVPNRAHGFGSAHTIRRCWDYFVLHLHGQTPPPYSIGRG